MQPPVSDEKGLGVCEDGERLIAAACCCVCAGIRHGLSRILPGAGGPREVAGTVFRSAGGGGAVGFAGGRGGGLP